MSRVRKPVAVAVLAAVLAGGLVAGVVRAAPAHAEAPPILLSDIDDGPFDDNAGNFFTVGSTVFFAGTDRVHGEELWATDGTPAGSRLVKDINVGADDSSPSNLVAFGSLLLFSARADATGRELWVSDGSPAGTVLLADANPGIAAGAPQNVQVVGGIAYFDAFSTDRGRELWRTDGTPAGTVRLSDINPGPSDSSPTRVAPVGAGGTVVFGAMGGLGTELYRSDGTTAGTVLLSDIAPGATSSAIASQIVSMSGKAFVVASQPGAGRELFSTDGVTTSLVSDIVPGTASSSPFGLLQGPSGQLFFAAFRGGIGTELFSSDGTGAGTKLVKDIFTGGMSSSPSSLFRADPHVYFTAITAGEGRELHRSDGTAAGTSLVADVHPGITGSVPSILGAAGGRVFFSASTAALGLEPYSTDGTPAGTVLLGDLRSGTAGSAPGAFTPVGGTVVFRAISTVFGRELFRTDGTAAGTAPLDVWPGAQGSTSITVAVLAGRAIFSAYEPIDGVVVRSTDGVTVTPLRRMSTGTGASLVFSAVGAGAQTVFGAQKPESGTELWVTDGSPAGTRLLSDIVPGVASGGATPYAALPSGVALFIATTPELGTELYRTDGTPAGTTLVKDINPGAATTGFSARPLPLGDHVYFGANENATGTELWRSDGTAAGTTLVSDIIPGLGGGFFSLLGVAGGSLYLSASRSDVGNEPFRVAPSGVVSLVSDIVAGTTGSSPSDVAEAGGTVYLSAGELLRTDGTPGGTTTIKDILPGAGLSEPSGMIATGSRLTFSARDGVAGRELWASDGTGAGTVMLADIFPGVTSSIGTFVGTTGTRALFSADNGVNGQELWSTDGTPGGTALLSDLRPGPEGSDPFGFDAFQRVPAPRVLFDADDGVFGLELWSSDGTAAGTRRVSDINPGAGSSDPELLRVLPDGSLLVSATDPAHGFEPRVFPSGSSFFFAEGTVRPGFAEYITLQNPGLLATSAVLSFQAARDDGAPVVIADLTRPVAANSRVTININDYVASLGISGAVNLSVKVTSPGVIGAERPVYFAADPALGTVVDGGHDVVGSRFPLLEWAFAEGTVRPGFVEYLTLQNPGAAGTAKLRYQAARDDGSPVVIPDDSRVLPANSRVTVNVNEYLASKGITGAVNLSVVVSADVPIVAERPVYFVADPALGSTVDGGTNVVGAREDADTWSFAEGTVRAGFVEYVTIQNPGGLAATATLTYQAARDDGSAVAVPDQSVAVPANSRVTINVNQYLADRGIAPPVNLSFKLTSTRPVVVERPIYFSADPGVGDLVEGGHDVVGTVLPATAWSLAEGTVRPGFVEYLTLQNPGDTATTAALAYQAANDAGTVVGVPTQTVALPARSRVTVNVNSYLTANAVPTPLNISVRVTSTVPIVVERPIYFVADPGTGTPVSDGHNVIGAPD